MGTEDVKMRTTTDLMNTENGQAVRKLMKQHAEYYRVAMKENHAGVWWSTPKAEMFEAELTLLVEQQTKKLLEALTLAMTSVIHDTVKAQELGRVDERELINELEKQTVAAIANLDGKGGE